MSTATSSTASMSQPNDVDSKIPEQLADHDVIPNNSLLKTMDFLLSTMRSKRVSMSALQAVLCLYVNPTRRVSLTKLARNLGISTAAVTGTADNLERLGFAKRQSDESDRRNTFVCLTPRGKVFAAWVGEVLNGDADYSGPGSRQTTASGTLHSST